MNCRLSLIAAVSAAVLLSSAGLATADPPSKPGRSGHIRLSNTSALHQGAVSRVAATAADDDEPPADVLGSPASSMIVRSDQLLISDRDVNANGNPMTGERVQLDSSLGFKTEGPKQTEKVRPLVNGSYPTAAGRFLDQAADKALAFRHQVAGDGQGLWTVADIGSVADGDARTAGATVGKPEIGKTYTINATLSGPAGSVKPHVAAPDGAWGSAVTLAGASDRDDDKQWSVVRGSADGWVRLVSVFDGFCLDALGAAKEAGSPIGTFPCVDGAANQEWSVNAGGHLTNRNSGLTASVVGGTSLAQETDDPRQQNQDVSFTETTEPHGVIPTVTFGGDADPATPYDLAVGDLDRTVDAGSGDYHDEAVAVWGGDHTISVRVIDYNRPDDTFTVTGPDSDLTAQLGAQDGNVYRAGSLNTAIGDFDGDGRNEIAVTWQDAKSAFHVAFLRYADDGGTPKLTVLQADQPLMASLADAPTPVRISGMADLIAGDFDGTGRESLALGWAGSKSTVVDGLVAPFLTVVRFGSDLKPTAATWGQLTGDKVVFLADADLYGAQAQRDYTQTGIRLAAGVFDKNEPNLHRRQIASVVRVQEAADAVGREETIGITRQVVVHHVTVPDPTKPNVLQLEGLTSQLQLPDNGSNVRPVSLAAGGFLGQGDPGDVPVWGLAVTQSDGDSGHSYVQMVGVDNAGRTLTRPYRTADLGERQYTLTSYDQAGESLVLGAPTRFTYTDMPRVSVVAAQPPAHADWLDGNFVNVSRTPDLNVALSTSDKQKFSSTRTDVQGHTMGVGEHSKWQAGDKVGIKGIFSIGGTVAVGQKMEKNWASENKTIDSNSHQSETKITSKTGDDDIVNGETKTTYIYRYPILNQKLKKADGSLLTDDSCPQGCYGFFEVSLPGPVIQGSFAGRDVDWYQPTWQNGNALSYPDASDPTIVPSDDLGSYSYQDANNQTQTQTGPLFDQESSLSAVQQAAELTIADKVGGGSERTSTTTLANSAFVNLTEKVNVLDSSYSGEQGADFSDTSTHSHIDVGETTTSTASAFSLAMPQIASNEAYLIRTAYYYDKSGAQKVIHGVDLTSSAQGKQWWAAHYAQQADPALNLPFSTITVSDSSGTFGALKWNEDPIRQKIRGFDVLDDQNEISRSNPVADDTVTFRTQIHNYSLKAAGSFSVRWYAVPVNDLGLKVEGPAQAIGGPQTVTGIAARGMVSVTSPAWTAKTDGADDQHWRIFVQLDPTGTLAEIHPLAGSTCPEESVSDGKTLIDPMTGTEEQLGCGENNQGYGEVVVSPQLPQGTKSTTVDLDGSTLIAGSRALPGGAPTPVARVVVGQPLTGVVKATSDGISREHQTVVVYDGDPDKGGQGIASTTMRGTAAGSGYATFSWTPKTPGTHVLYQKLMGRTAAEGISTQTLTVEVVDQPVASSVVITSGNFQTAAPGAAFGKPLAVHVLDQFGQPLAGQPVNFTVTAGAARFGAATSASVTTDAQGSVTAPALTAGRAIGPVAVQVTSGSATALFVAAVSTAPVKPADLVTKVKARSKVKVGKTFAAKVSVTNKGPGNAGDVLLAVSVPSRLAIRDHGPGRRVGNVVFYRISSVKNGRHRTFTLKLRARSAGKATIVATTMSTTPDPHKGNNTRTDKVRARK